MDPLISALLVVGWGLFSLWVGWRAMRRVRATLLKLVALPVVAVVTLFAPFADEIIGAIQFERYCAAANHVPIYGTIPVGEDLYFPDGRWRLRDPAATQPVAETNRLIHEVNRHVKRDYSKARHVSAVIPVEEYTVRFLDRKTGSLLAEYRFYGTSGGWVARIMGVGPSFMREQCFPNESAWIEEKLLVYRPRHTGGKS